MAGSPTLEVRGVTKSFARLRVLNNVDLDAGDGEIVGLVGPNGSGKTTLINIISGIYGVDHGQVRIEGRDVTSLSPFKRARLGVNRTFQSPRPFKDLTVYENLAVAWRSCHARGNEAEALEAVLELLGLTSYARRPSGELTGVSQKRVDLARALVTSPKVLLVDELGAGLTTGELDELADLLQRIVADRKLAMVVVEHLLGFLEKLTQRVVVLSSGEEIFTGDMRSALHDDVVLRVFLGSAAPGGSGE